MYPCYYSFWYEKVRLRPQFIHQYSLHHHTMQRHLPSWYQISIRVTLFPSLLGQINNFVNGPFSHSRNIRISIDGLSWLLHSLHGPFLVERKPLLQVQYGVLRYLEYKNSGEILIPSTTSLYTHPFSEDDCYPDQSWGIYNFHLSEIRMNMHVL